MWMYLFWRWETTRGTCSSAQTKSIGNQKARASPVVVMSPAASSECDTIDFDLVSMRCLACQFPFNAIGLVWFPIETLHRASGLEARSRGRASGPAPRKKYTYAYIKNWGPKVLWARCGPHILYTFGPGPGYVLWNGWTP